ASDGIRFIALWKKRVQDPTAPKGRRIVHGGSYDLGPKARHGSGFTSLSAARKHWATIAKGIVSRSDSPAPPPSGKIHPQVTFREYCERSWLPTRKERWAETTTENNLYYFESKLYPAFGDTRLCEMTEPVMQRFLNDLVKQKYSKTVIQHCRVYLMAVIQHAHKRGVIPEDTAFELQMPRGIRREDRPYLSMAEYQQLLVPLPTQKDKIMTKLLYLGGVRRGELFALRWNDYNGISLLIDSQINSKGNEGPPKNEASHDYIALPTELREDLDEWRTWCPDSSPGAFIFPSHAGSPINHTNWRRRILEPAAKKAGLLRINFHMFRRGLATEMHHDGAVDKSIQGQLRHGDPNVSRRIYMQTVSKEQQASIEKLSKKAKKVKKTT
ncbi:MAG TPA: site-specific integrase, partial [Bryobacteraceae bacterium]|nr:site-specific integrase [Bryobacteraceae bacterium]